MSQKEIVFKGSRPFNDGKALKDIFSSEVGNDRMAWYVDYFLEDPSKFQVRFLAEDSNGVTVRMTNENKEQRDPNDQWGANDVSRWFQQEIPGSDSIEHRWIILFSSPVGEIWGLHLEANRVFLFGPNALSLPTENLWEDYVENGISGPIKASNHSQSVFLSLVIDPDLFGALDKENVLQDYMIALAGILDN
jgi:hypothetical protein